MNNAQQKRLFKLESRAQRLPDENDVTRLSPEARRARIAELESRMTAEIPQWQTLSSVQKIKYLLLTKADRPAYLNETLQGKGPLNAHN